ncbi:hypothetical protein A2335_01650 [Candidatus Peregrinibacteria bacterium RIFOXYB2_FULL_32_7]|nr:MAG: hypothetical protein A2335_01650 [Candidatus Peregrinibacteria bacterium RIFOXYB2_FULL_32_7]
MKIEKDKEENKDYYLNLFKYAKLKMTGYTVAITFVNIAVFGYVGSKIDEYLNTKPGFFIALLVISFPISQFIVYKKIKNLLK